MLYLEIQPQFDEQVNIILGTNPTFPNPTSTKATNRLENLSSNYNYEATKQRNGGSVTIVHLSPCDTIIAHSYKGIIMALNNAFVRVKLL